MSESPRQSGLSHGEPATEPTELSYDQRVAAAVEAVRQMEAHFARTSAQ
ncbi:MAG: hypothetical protein ABEH61_01880 [Haloarculaceae archaeon]